MVLIKEAIGIGSTIEEARENGAKELGVESYETEFEILQEPEKKVFGLFGGCPAKVRVFIKQTPVEVAAQYLKDVLAAMEVTDVEMTVTENENAAEINIEGEQIGAVIGRRGETLDALQYLTGLVANHVDNSYYRITINTSNYREKREKTLEILGRKLAFKAVKTGYKTSLEPMNPYERRIIHTAVQKVNGAISWSEGESIYRHVVIGPDPNAKTSYHKGGYNKNKYGKRPYNNKPRYNKSQSDMSDSPKREPINEGAEFGLYGRIDNK